MANPKTEDIKVRLPAAIKAALRQIADSRFTTESEIAREALLEYLARRNVQLREEAVLTAPLPEGKPVTYGKAKGQVSKKDTERKILDIVKQKADQARRPQAKGLQAHRSQFPPK
jgi:predicted transcriptional regulator